MGKRKEVRMKLIETNTFNLDPLVIGEQQHTTWQCIDIVNEYVLVLSSCYSHVPHWSLSLSICYTNPTSPVTTSFVCGLLYLPLVVVSYLFDAGKIVGNRDRCKYQQTFLCYKTEGIYQHEVAELR